MDISLTHKDKEHKPLRLFGKKHKSKSVIPSEIFRGIEVDLFSYTVAPDRFQEIIQSVCGEHFDVRLQPEVSEDFATYYIAPKEYCLVEGGMMYSSAGSIISELISRGFLIKGYWTVK
ncbi:MAG: hypothetical protein ACFHU9_04770 [Fluviicola sp.]